MKKRHEGPPPDNIIDFDPNKQLTKNLEKTGEMDQIKNRAGEEIQRYEARKKENKETLGKWSVWVLDDTKDGRENVVHLITREEDGKLKLSPNNAESTGREAIFKSDQEAEKVIKELKKEHPQIEEKGLRWGLMCGGLEDEQPDNSKPDLKVIPGKKEEYKKRHNEIWPELKKLLKENGISDYTIYYDEETNILFATQKISGEGSSQDLGDKEIVQKWWDYMADIMETNPDNSPVEVELEEVFHMD